MRDILRPTSSIFWVAILLWSSYWLIGKLDSFVAFQIVLIYPNYLSALMRTLQPQTDAVMTAIPQSTIAVANVFLVVHVTVAAVAGYIGACAIVRLVKQLPRSQR